MMNLSKYLYLPRYRSIYLSVYLSIYIYIYVDPAHTVHGRETGEAATAFSITQTGSEHRQLHQSRRAAAAKGRMESSKTSKSNATAEL